MTASCQSQKDSSQIFRVHIWQGLVATLLWGHCCHAVLKHSCSMWRESPPHTKHAWIADPVSLDNDILAFSCTKTLQAPECLLLGHFYLSVRGQSGRRKTRSGHHSRTKWQARGCISKLGFGVKNVESQVILFCPCTDQCSLRRTKLKGPDTKALVEAEANIWPLASVCQLCCCVTCSVGTSWTPVICFSTCTLNQRRTRWWERHWLTIQHCTRRETSPSAIYNFLLDICLIRSSHKPSVMSEHGGNILNKGCKRLLCLQFVYLQY